MTYDGQIITDLEQKLLASTHPNLSKLISFIITMKGKIFLSEAKGLFDNAAAGRLFREFTTTKTRIETISIGGHHKRTQNTSKQHPPSKANSRLYSSEGNC